MKINKYLHLFALLPLAFFTIFICYHAVLKPPQLFYYTTDELFASDAGVLLFYNLPNRCLEWPALLNVWASAAIFLKNVGSSLLNTGEPVTFQNLFKHLDSTAAVYFQNPAPALTQQRFLQIGLIAILFLFIHRAIAQSTHRLVDTPVKKSLFFLFLLCSGLFWNFASVVRPDALAAALFLLILVRIFLEDEFDYTSLLLNISLVSLLFSQRLIYAFYLPFFVVVTWLAVRRQKLNFKKTAFSVFVAFTSLVAFNPYLITSSLTIMKGFIGQLVAKRVASSNVIANIASMLQDHGSLNWVLYLLLASIGIIYALRQQMRVAAYYVLLFNVVLIAQNILITPHFTISHLIIVIPVLLFFGSTGVVVVYEYLSKFKSSLLANATVMVLLGVCFAVAVFEAHRFQSGFKKQTNVAVVLEELKKPTWQQKKIAVEAELEAYIPKSLKMILHETAFLENQHVLHAKLKHMFKGKIGNEVPIIIQQTAGEDEKQALVTHRLMASHLEKTASKEVFPEVHFFTTQPNTVVYMDGLATTADKFKAGKYDALVTFTGVEGLWPSKFIDSAAGKPVFIYKNKQ